MRIEVNGIRLFFDVEGAKLVADGPVMRETGLDPPQWQLGWPALDIRR